MNYSEIITKKIFFIFILASLSLQSVFAQENKEFKELFRQAEYYMITEDFEQAIPKYKQLLQMDPENANLHFLIGYCYLYSNDPYLMAIKHLEKASMNVVENYNEGSYYEKNAPQITFFSLGRAYLKNYELQKAEDAFMKYRDLLDYFDFAEIEYVNRNLKSCEIAKILIKHPLDISFKKQEINNIEQFSYTNPVVSGNDSMMIFNIYEKDEEFVAMATKEDDSLWSEPIIINRQLNLSKKTSPVSLSYKGDMLFLAVNNDESSDIYVSHFNNGNWSVAEDFGSQVNTRYIEDHACITKDNQTLYFTSNRKGGWGGMDIYRTKLKKNGKWDKPENLGFGINTFYNEVTPFINYHDSVLFFSSEGHETMGGYDVFYSKMDKDGNFTDVKNIGYPISTTSDDIFFYPLKENYKAYLYLPDILSPDLEQIYAINEFQLLERPELLIADLPLEQKGTQVDESETPNLSPQEIKQFADRSISDTTSFVEQKSLEKEDLKDELAHNEIARKEVKSVTDTVKLEIQSETIQKADKEEVRQDELKQTDPMRLEAEEEMAVHNKLQQAEPEQVEAKNELANQEELKQTDPMRLEVEEELAFQNELNQVDPVQVEVQDELANQEELNQGKPDQVEVKEEISNQEEQKLLDPLQMEVKEELLNQNRSKQEDKIINYQKDNILTDNQKTERKEEDFYYVLNNILFDFNSYNLNSKSIKEVEHLAAMMNMYESVQIELIGKADSVGSFIYNFELAKKRAISIKNVLISKGVNPERILLKSQGEAFPVALNTLKDGSDSKKGRALNRSVEIRINNEGLSKIRIAEIFVPPDLVPEQDKAYCIFLLESKGLLDTVPKKLIGLPVSLIFTNNTRIYALGNFKSKLDAIENLDKILNLGYTEAGIMEKRRFENVIRNRSNILEFSSANYTIQVHALKNSKNLNLFDNLENLKMYDCKDGFYRYTEGEYRTIEEAQKSLVNVRNKGYEEAFIMPIIFYQAMVKDD